MDSWFFARLALAVADYAIRSSQWPPGTPVPLRVDLLFEPDFQERVPANNARPFKSLEQVRAFRERHRLQQHADGATVHAAGELPAGRKNRC